jgi:signal transduction histidine kinase
MNASQPIALDERLRHELGNALMGVLTHAELLDRRFPDDAFVHDAVERIRAAVVRSRSAVDEASRELADVARRLSSARER